MIFFYYQTIDYITVYTCEARFLKLLLQHAYHSYIKLTVHEQYIIAFAFCRFDITVLFILVVCIKVDKVPIFVCLIIFNKRLILFECIILVVCISEESKILGFLIKIFLSK